MRGHYRPGVMGGFRSLGEAHGGEGWTHLPSAGGGRAGWDRGPGNDKAEVPVLAGAPTGTGENAAPLSGGLQAHGGRTGRNSGPPEAGAESRAARATCGRGSWVRGLGGR